jgi:hypothetical protein
MYYLPSINEFRFYHATFFLRTLLVASEVILSLPMCHKHFVEPLSQIRRESRVLHIVKMIIEFYTLINV